MGKKFLQSNKCSKEMVKMCEYLQKDSKGKSQETKDIPYFFGYKTEFFPSKTIPKI